MAFLSTDTERAIFSTKFANMVGYEPTPERMLDFSMFASRYLPQGNSASFDISAPEATGTTSMGEPIRTVTQKVNRLIVSLDDEAGIQYKITDDMKHGGNVNLTNNVLNHLKDSTNQFIEGTFIKALTKLVNTPSFGVPTVSPTVGGNASGITSDVLADVVSKFGNNYIKKQDYNFYLLVTPDQYADLMKDQKSTSIDYVEDKPITSGKFHQMLHGFRIVEIPSFLYIQGSAAFGLPVRTTTASAGSPAVQLNSAIAFASPKRETLPAPVACVHRGLHNLYFDRLQSNLSVDLVQSSFRMTAEPYAGYCACKIETA